MSARTAVVAVACLIAAAAGVAAFIGDGSSGTKGTEAGRTLRPAASFELPGLRPDEPAVSLAATAGKPTVLNFFAAWCEPCKEELPALRDAAAAYAGVNFVGIDHQDSREDAVEILERFGVTYPAGYDPRGDVAARYGVRGLPATVFIDAEGRIVEMNQGALSAAAFDDRLRRLTLRSTTP